MLASDFGFSVKRATTYVPDARALHFWDRAGQLSNDYARVLQMDPGTRAWDVYLVYGPEKEWGDQPPQADYVMDQLGLDRGHPLDGDELAAQIRNSLAALK